MVLRRNVPTVSESVFRQGMAQLCAATGVDMTEDSPGHVKITTLWGALHRNRWSEERYKSRVEQCIDTFRYPTWTVAEFLDDEPQSGKKRKKSADEVVLITHAMFLERTKGKAEGWDMYQVPIQGKPGETKGYYVKHDGSVIEGFEQYLRICDGKRVQA